MAWTYDPSKLASVPTYRVRLEIGDTEPDDRLLQDEEIADALARNGNAEMGAAALCAERVAAKFSRQATVSTGQVSVQYAERARTYRELAGRLRTRAGFGARPFVGGASKSDMDRFTGDEDQVQPRFTRDLHEDRTATQDPVRDPRSP